MVQVTDAAMTGAIVSCMTTHNKNNNKEHSTPPITHTTRTLLEHSRSFSRRSRTHRRAPLHCTHPLSSCSSLVPILLAPITTAQEPYHTSTTSMSCGQKRSFPSFTPPASPPLSECEGLEGNCEPTLSFPAHHKKRKTEQESDQCLSPSTPSRCSECSRRLGLLGIQCRCGLIFCASHRYSQEHGCPYDYREPTRIQLTRDNPKLCPDKLPQL